MVNHNIVWLNITVHDSLTVTEVQRFQEFVNIEADVVVGEPGVQRAEIRVVHVFKNQTRRFALAIANDIKQGYHVGTTRQILKNLDLTLNLLLLDRLEDLDDTLLIVDYIDALEHFGVFSPAYRSTPLACVRIESQMNSAFQPFSNIKQVAKYGKLTNLADHFVVFQHTPRNVYTVIIPVGPGHTLIDVCINARHCEWRLLTSKFPKRRTID